MLNLIVTIALGIVLAWLILTFLPVIVAVASVVTVVIAAVIVLAVVAVALGKIGLLGPLLIALIFAAWLTVAAKTIREIRLFLREPTTDPNGVWTWIGFAGGAPMSGLLAAILFEEYRIEETISPALRPVVALVALLPFAFGLGAMAFVAAVYAFRRVRRIID